MAEFVSGTLSISCFNSFTTQRYCETQFLRRHLKWTRCWRSDEGYWLDTFLISLSIFLQLVCFLSLLRTAHHGSNYNFVPGFFDFRNKNDILFHKKILNFDIMQAHHYTCCLYIVSSFYFISSLSMSNSILFISLLLILFRL